MLDYTRVTDALSLTSVTPVYSPACLLDVSSLDARITTDTNFVEGCERGYLDYFDPDEIEDWLVIAQTAPHTMHQILGSLFSSLLSLIGESDFPEHIPFMIGHGVGWLSAIAVAQPEEAATGMLALISEVETLYKENYVRFETPAQREQRVFLQAHPIRVYMSGEL